jgi:hypothetical protein
LSSYCFGRSFKSVAVCKSPAADAASRDRWNHTASLLALLANCHRDPKKSRASRPKDFHPHAKANRPHRDEPLPRVGVEALKQVFVDRGWRPESGG